MTEEMFKRQSSVSQSLESKTVSRQTEMDIVLEKREVRRSERKGKSDFCVYIGGRISREKFALTTNCLRK